MELSKEEKIKRYHYEEILLILFICASDVSKYNDDNLVFFAECVEGRIEDLFVHEYLKSLGTFFQTDENILENFDQLKSILRGMYSSQWHKKMNIQDLNWQNANYIAKRLLGAINVEYVEPIFFADNHLNIDWT